LRILLTGGLGYLGGRLAQTLAGAPDHELILGTRRRVAAAPPWLPQATIAAMDWSDERELARVCRGMDAIVHLAGMNAKACAKDPLGALAFNGVATARLLRAAIEQGVSRFIYLSTAHVYGAALSGSVDEKTCPAPRHPYATSHRAGEDAVLMAHAAGTVQGIVVRLSNSFGAPVEPEVDCWSLLVNDLCRQAVATRQMVLRTAGQQRRDFVAISDACRAIVHLLKAPAAIVAEGLFNVGSGWAPTLLEMAEKAASRVESVLGFRPQIRTGVARDAVGDGKLDFGIRRILDTGFEWPQQSIVEELDRLIVFCARHAANTGRAV
jgi:UDP-glucose 4-epimerase